MRGGQSEENWHKEAGVKTSGTEALYSRIILLESKNKRYVSLKVKGDAVTLTAFSLQFNPAWTWTCRLPLYSLSP